MTAMAGVPREPTYSLLAVPCFSRHREALDWARSRLVAEYGTIALESQEFSFHHTKYYLSAMGTGLLKKIFVFDQIFPADILPVTKRFSIALENELASSGLYPEPRPINIDPGLVQLGKFLLASTKDQAHRIYLQDDIFGEVTLRFEAGAFEVWPWTYADYHEESVRAFLNQARALLYEKVTALRKIQGK
jgi:hypothetical protein